MIENMSVFLIKIRQAGFTKYFMALIY